MRTGIFITVSAADRRRLEAVVTDRNTAQKHVWRARIVLLTAEGAGTHAIMAATGKSKTTVWRWQARFAEAGVEGLLSDKTRPPGKPPVADQKVAEIV
ncbi:MAG: helix-turn-helix domain-containing protein, partial [Pikeienuella sp.]